MNMDRVNHTTDVIRVQEQSISASACAVCAGRERLRMQNQRFQYLSPSRVGEILEKDNKHLKDKLNL